VFCEDRFLGVAAVTNGVAQPRRVVAQQSSIANQPA
jgi:hypothetical protein